MKKYSKYQILIAIGYISILILSSLLNNTIVLAIIGSIIIVIDKFIIPNLKELKEKFNLEKNIKQLYEILLIEGLEPNMAINLALLIKKIGETNFLRFLKLTLETFDEEEYESYPDYSLINQTFNFSIKYKYGRNQVRIYRDSIFYDYSNVVSNKKIKEDFLGYFKEECNKEGIKLKK